MSAKISHELEEELTRVQRLARPKKIRVLVEFTRRPSVQALESVRKRFTTKIVYQSKVTPYVAMEVDVDRIEDIARLRTVKKVWHIPTFYPLEERPPQYLALAEAVGSVTLIESAKHIGIDVVKAAGFTGKNVLIALVDSGVDQTHPMLEGKVVVEKSFHPIDTNPTDYLGHGSWCGSCIAGRYWKDPVSGREFEGMAPDAMLINAKIFSYGGADFPEIMEALEWSCEQGAQISSNSWGGLGSFEPMRTLIRTLIQTYGTIFVFAGGNTGPDYYTITYPGGDPETIGVGSVGVKNPSVNAIAPFSGRGPSAYMKVKPDIMAPGGVDDRNWGNPEELVCAAGLNQSVKCTRGTSMACPHIAGGLALLLEAGVADPVTQLYNTARDLMDSGKDNDSGLGVADFAKALGLSPLNPHVLTVETSISGIQFYVNGWVLETPYSEELGEGTYIISVPKTMFVDSSISEFTGWQDGETSPTRTIGLTSDTGLKANYTKLDAYVVYVTDDVRVDEGYPDLNLGGVAPILTRACTYGSGVRGAGRFFLKFDLTRLPEVEVIGAKLYLRAYELKVPRNIEVYGVPDDSWGEKSITWNNKPPLGDLLSTIRVDSIGLYEWDITDFVKSEYLADKIVSLCFKDSVEDTTPGDYYDTYFEAQDYPPPPSGKGVVPYIILEVVGGPKGTLEVHAYVG